MNKKIPMDENLEHYFEKFSKQKILVVGDLMQDIFIWGNVRRISPEAPVPVVEVTKETAMFGGACNVAYNLIALGAKVSLAGVVGDDHAGRSLMRALKKNGIDCQAVAIEEGRLTSVKTRIIAHSQQVVRFDKEQKNPISQTSLMKIVSAIKAIMKEVQLVVISDYAKGVIRKKLMEEILDMAKKQNKKVLVDPKVANLAYYKGAYLITPNHLEAEQATGMKAETDREIEKAGKALLSKLKINAVVITRGEAGMSLITKDGLTQHFPTQAREVYDVTGAGDTVISTLALALASGMKISSAVVLANFSAGIGVSKLGTSVVSQDELKAFLREKGLY